MVVLLLIESFTLNVPEMIPIDQHTVFLFKGVSITSLGLIVAIFFAEPRKSKQDFMKCQLLGGVCG